MSFQFQCPGCSRQLAVGDEFLDQKIRCPSCNEVFQINQPATPLEATILPEEGGATAPNDPENPFAAPRESSNQQPESDLLVKKDIRPTKIYFSETLQLSWDLFKENAGVSVLMGFLLCALYLVMLMPTYIVVIIAHLSENIPMIVVGHLIFFLAIQAIVSVLTCLGVSISLKILRKDQPLENLFAGLQYFWPTFGFWILYNLIIIGIFVVLGGAVGGVGAGLFMSMGEGAMPVIIFLGVVGYLCLLVVAWYVMGRLCLTPFFIVDRQLPVIESMKISSQCMQGNKLTFIGLMIVISFASIPVSMFTCGIGYIVILGFIGLFMSLVYFKASGQLLQQTDIPEGVNE